MSSGKLAIADLVPEPRNPADTAVIGAELLELDGGEPNAEKIHELNL